jgi:putative holliday junction resolvase
LPAASPAASFVLPLEAFAAGLPLQGRLMSLDVGTKTIGIAISDTTRMVASGVETLQRTKFGADALHLIAVVKTHAVVGVVIGLPTSLDGTAGPRVQSTRAFAANLGPRLGLPLLLWDERLSTVAAERALLEADASRRRRKEVIDKVAAVIILQGALERMREMARVARTDGIALYDAPR